MKTGEKLLSSVFLDFYEPIKIYVGVTFGVGLDKTGWSLATSTNSMRTMCGLSAGRANCH